MGQRAWWVAPTYKIAAVGWQCLHRMAGQIPVVQIREADLRINIGHGSVAVRSADNPQSLRGEGLDFVVLDECAFIDEQAWAEALRPTLSDRRGGAMFISTPRGHNWFWRLWQRGQSGDYPDWHSWQLPTADNPYIAPAEIEAARGEMTERAFAQEYQAQFMDDAGGVFRRIFEVTTGEPREPEPGHSYIMGADWGKYEDYTVLSVIDLRTKRLVAKDRFSQIDYALQTQRLRALAERYRPIAIIAEANSMGEPVIEQLQRMNLPVQPFITTNASKSVIIESLALALERGELTLLNDPILIGELQAYEMERLPGGLMRYGAPQGVHDDCVMSLALAWHGANSAIDGPVVI